ncbi:hypothetical protein AB0I55_19885 [Actinocatenispora sera]|uniref:hypothetical protein n=1 Tax=Actinocatenispora sera TaxID=390989 RepID=UPI0033D29107
MSSSVPSAEQRLFDAAMRWPNSGGTADAHQHLIDAATQALLDGLDSPGLRMLAGASTRDRSDELSGLLDTSLTELSIPRPGTMEPWQRIESGGRIYSRLPTDTIRFAVAPVHESVGGHEVRVYVNEVELTSLGAGLGMDPFDLLAPTNRLVATAQPQRVPIARCECGVYGCDATDVLLARDGDVVHWEWRGHAPLDHGVSFLAAGYDAEVARIGADRSWETAHDTTARLVLAALDDKALARYGLRYSWAAPDRRDDRRFVVSLWMDADGPDGHAFQVFLRIGRGGRTPEEVAADVARIVRRPPERWPATYHCTAPGVEAAPTIAGASWRRERLG